jgi:hypothetical protein
MHATQCCRVVLTALALVAVAGTARADTAVIQPSSQDAYVMQDFPNRPRGSGLLNTRFHVRTSTPNPRIRRGLVQFDLSSIPQYSTVNLATLDLYQDSSPVPAHTNEVYRITDFWLQSSVKWNTQPTIQALATDSTTVGPVRQFYSWVVTADVQAWLNAPGTNHGWMVKDADETGSNDIISYVSLEESSVHDVGKRPRLTVDFTAPPCITDDDCADTNPCTVNERCPTGFCVVDPADCNDNDACTDDICDPDQGCLHPVGECNDGFSCTIDTCDSQIGCVNTAVPAVCEHEGCQEGTCVADPDDPTLDPVTGCLVTAVHADGSACNADVNACTDDVCAAGECTHPNSAPGTSCPSDGNVCTDDVCDGAGVCGVNNTAPCEDGDLCTQNDQCANGLCVPGALVVCTALGQCYDVGTCDPQTGVCSNPPKASGGGCNDANACTHDDECDGAGGCAGSATPQLGCRKPLVAGKAFLQLRNKTPDKRDALAWRWVKGQATSIADFGDPLTSGASDYTLCVFDGSPDPQPRLAVTAPAGGTCGTKPCWKMTRTGYKYKNRLFGDGALSIVERPGADSKAKVIIRGKGTSLGMPPLPPTFPVTVQLKRDDDANLCWEETYSTAEKNSSDRFKAFGDGP